MFLSPYQYGANNPVNNIDINGDSIWYTLNDNIVTMHVAAKIFNNSSDNINMKRAAKDIVSDIKVLMKENLNGVMAKLII